MSTPRSDDGAAIAALTEIRAIVSGGSSVFDALRRIRAVIDCVDLGAPAEQAADALTLLREVNASLGRIHAAIEKGNADRASAISGNVLRMETHNG